jgi:glycosyltransferase involved in cell wall biosynthesis
MPADQANPQSVLISTIVSVSGGVSAMTRRVIEYLSERNYEVGLAYYQPYSLSPELSVPSWQLLNKSPRARTESALDGVLAHAIGVRLPEFEFAHYLPTKLWREVLSRYQYHMVVSGSVLAAFPIVWQRRPCLAWVATPYLADRKDRASAFPLYRRMFDQLVDVPICRRMERRALRSVRLLAISSYTAREIRRLAPAAHVATMPFAIRSPELGPVASSSNDPRHGWRVGFAGRYDDPRKNISLLLDAFAICRQRGHDARLSLVGAEPSEALRRRAKSMGLEAYIDFGGHLSRAELRDYYRTLDVFVVSSHQEGLGIAALEAMACGCPVVSTRCGGPEDYIVPGKNGFLVSGGPEAMAEAICQIADNRETQKRMGEAAVRTVADRYTDDTAVRIFWEAFDQTYATEPP